jgi:hypothetical protein
MRRAVEEALYRRQPACDIIAGVHTIEVADILESKERRGTHRRHPNQVTTGTLVSIGREPQAVVRGHEVEGGFGERRAPIDNVAVSKGMPTHG